MPAEHRAGENWRVERTCPICWTAFTPAQPSHTYCSQRCRKTGHVRRHAEPAAPPGSGPRAATGPRPAPVTVRACPHCGAEVSIVALLTTPEAARPTLPEPGVVPLRRA